MQRDDLQVASLQAEIAQLRAANTMLERYAVAVAHDLAAPLRAIHANLAIAKRRHGTAMPVDLQELVDEAEGGAKRLSAAIAGHLALARGVEGRASFAMVSLETVAAEVRAALATDLAASGGSIVVQSLPVVWGNATLLGLLLQNLVQNSLRYRSEAAPEVIIDAAPFGDNWCVSVHDNGVGIEADAATELLQPNVRGHAAAAEDGGLGLGLHACTLIASRHGGQLWLEPRKGGGTIARFTVAAISAGAEPAPAGGSHV